MPQGSADHLLFDRLLTNVVYEKGMGMEGIAKYLAPRVRSTTITGQYMKRKRGERDAGVKTERAPGAEVQTGERRGKSLETFRTVDHALSELIPQEITSGMGETELQNERTNTAQDVLQKIQHDWESDVHDLVWAANAGAFDTKYGARSISPGAKWDSATPNMKLDILNLKTRIYRAVGKKPNTMVLPNEVFNVITTKDNELRDAIKYTQGGPVTMDILARYFEVERVLVPMYLTDNADGANEEEMDFLWTGDHVGMFYVDESSSRNKITLASTFYWDSPDQPFFGTYTGFNRKRKSEEVEVGGYFSVEEIDISCGGVIKDVFA